MRKRPLVAIVDDDESIRYTTKDLLASAGFSAVAFASAASLLKSRRLTDVSCLIADNRMPEMTGLELHQHLLETKRAVPTVLISAYADERVREQALKNGVLCFLCKPFAADELLSCVRSALQRPRRDTD